METQFYRKTFLVSSVSESKTVALVISSSPHSHGHGPIVALVSALWMELTKLDYVSMLFIEQSNMLALTRTVSFSTEGGAMTHLDECHESMNWAKIERQGTMNFTLDIINVRECATWWKIAVKMTDEMNLKEASMNRRIKPHGQKWRLLRNKNCECARNPQ